MNTDPRHLLQLSVIIELGSFSLAAQQLNLTQPALSRNMKILEDRVGVQLIDRSHKKVQATQAGRALAVQGHSIRMATMQASEHARDISTGKAGLLRIGVPPMLSEYLLSAMITDFLKDNPNVNAIFTSTLMVDLIDKLELGQLDVVIGPLVLSDESRGLQVQQLWSDSISIFCRKGHPLTQYSRVSTQQLRGAKWITHPERSFLRAQMDSCLISAGLTEIGVAIEVDSPISIIAMVQNSDYLSMLPCVPLQSLVDSGVLAVLPFESNMPSRHTGVITRKTDRRTLLLERFIDFLAVKGQARDGAR
ncbi:LysR family transcriptional regulator [Marinobacterium rhizophilum]|uniref:LysR family transcriptional regulator n=1 Tax=Marinobacterium rhizophilum TaxID=420402 RepID=A0ABY5HMX6_9GAMM|nr:LysR family transcriptional regulator [Marinobacterium rhizophilum]UTW12602.1 LysR family transcriptional regulator [Marinobacterium rhizophilum]